jgi:hypothetical protein
MGEFRMSDDKKPAPVKKVGLTGGAASGLGRLQKAESMKKKGK